METVWVGLAALAALTPLGLLARGTAWGEWGTEELARRAGYVPARLAAVEAHGWKGFQLLPDYLSDRGWPFYALAGAAGIVLSAGALLLLGRLLARRESASPPPDMLEPDARASSVGLEDLPDWLACSSSDPVESFRTVAPASRPWGRFLQRSLAEFAHTAQQTVFMERWSGEKGLLQAIDPRVKLAAMLTLVLLTSCLHHAVALGALYGLSLALGLLSRLPLPVLLKRVWLTVPLFMGAVALPSTLSVITPGPPLLVLWRHPLLAITAPGLAVAGRFTLRIGVAVSFVMLLTLTTRWYELLRALRVLLLPRWLVTVLCMTYRYLDVVTRTASESFVARQSRTVGRVSRADERRFLGSALGSLFGKTLLLTEDVYQAMVSRGWTGDARTLYRWQLRRADLVWLSAMASAGLLAYLGDRIG